MKRRALIGIAFGSHFVSNRILETRERERKRKTADLIITARYSRVQVACKKIRRAYNDVAVTRNLFKSMLTDITAYSSFKLPVNHISGNLHARDP